jgi:pimeloyl-ACP methyl ester carboxylesterase
VGEILQRQGHRVFAPTLTGLGERSHLLHDYIDLSTHVTDVVNAVRWNELKDIVLCGHSYGGHVISGAAEQIQSSIRSIVYLDAVVSQDGDSLADLSAPLGDTVKSLLDERKMTIPPIPAAVFNVNEKDRAWVDRLCTPQPILTFTEKIALTGKRDSIALKTYIKAVSFQTATFEKGLRIINDDASWAKYEVPCGHDAMIDMPDRIAELLLERS